MPLYVNQNTCRVLVLFRRIREMRVGEHGKHATVFKCQQGPQCTILCKSAISSLSTCSERLFQNDKIIAVDLKFIEEPLRLTEKWHYVFPRFRYRISRKLGQVPASGWLSSDESDSSYFNICEGIKRHVRESPRKCGSSILNHPRRSIPARLCMWQ